LAEVRFLEILRNSIELVVLAIF